MRATNFLSKKIYQSPQRPSYTSWASFFPGERGEWYLGFVEMTKLDRPQPRASKEFVYGMALPRGYDTSKHKQELVLMKSADNLQTWKEVGRELVTANGGTFAQARTKDGKLLRFVWAAYSRDPATKPNEIYYQSSDEGKSWKKMPPFVSGEFAWYPHRLRTLERVQSGIPDLNIFVRERRIV
ncbi:MAG: hypothetical protein ACR2H1_14310 [Limisphaerales bacterium]